MSKDMLFLQDFNCLWSLWYFCLCLSMLYFHCGFISHALSPTLTQYTLQRIGKMVIPATSFFVYNLVTSFFLLWLSFYHISFLLLYFHELCLTTQEWGLWIIPDGGCYHTLLPCLFRGFEVFQQGLQITLSVSSWDFILITRIMNAN